MPADPPEDISPTVPVADPHRPRMHLMAWMALAYLLMILLGSLLFRLPGVMVNGGQLNYDRSLFLTISTASLTGFQQSIGFNDFNPDSPLGPSILLLLTVAGSLFVTIAGGMGAVRVLRFPYTDLQVITAALTVELLVILGGSGILFASGVHLGDSVQQAAAAFGNSGAVIIARGRYFPSFASAAAQGVLLPLSVLGGFGLPVLLDLYYAAMAGGRRLSPHSRVVLKMSAGIYLVATALLFISARLNSSDAPTSSRAALISAAPGVESVGVGPARAAFLAASTTAINARTAGLPFEILNRFPRSAQWFIVLLMLIGASPAGTGGGLKSTTLWHLFTGFSSVLRGRVVPRVFGIAGAWLGTYLAIAGISFFLLTLLEPQVPADRLIFLTISALSNVGLSEDPVSIVGPGLLLLGLVMLLGRLTPLAILWWMAHRNENAEVLVA